VDRACAKENIQSKYIYGLFTKQKKDIILEIYIKLVYAIINKMPEIL
jgi:hypothetical protein